MVHGAQLKIGAPPRPPDVHANHRFLETRNTLQNTRKLNDSAAGEASRGALLLISHLVLATTLKIEIRKMDIEM